MTRRCGCGGVRRVGVAGRLVASGDLTLVKVVLAAAGLEHSLALVVADQSSEPYLFAFGDNTYGQLGVEVSAIA